jgi:hypothetical protein
MKKLLTCLFVAMFVVGLTMSGLGCCAQNDQGAKDKPCEKKCDPKDCKKPCPEKKADGKCPMGGKKDAAVVQPAPAPAPMPAPAPAKPAQPAPQGEKK